MSIPIRKIICSATIKLLAFSLFLSYSPSTFSQDDIDLFVFAGQSNMVGADADPSQLPSSAADHEVLFWWACGDPPADSHDSTSGGEWTTLQVQPRGNPKPRDGATRQWGNFSSPQGGFGPEIGFARELMRRLLPNDSAEQNLAPKFAILKVAYSGTSLEGDWDSSQSHTEGNCFGALKKELEAAMQKAEVMQLRLRPKAFFWVQGESDSGADRRSRYEARLQKLIAGVRDLTNHPRLPVFLAVNTKFGGDKKKVDLQQVVAIQQRVADFDQACKYVDTSLATTANAAHYDAQGTLLVGKLFAQEFSKQE